MAVSKPPDLSAHTMVMMSDRKGFWVDSSQWESRGTWSAEVCAKGKECKHPGKLTALDKDPLARWNFHNLRVLVVVHGFNSDHDTVCKAYHTVRSHLRFVGEYDAIVGYVWPGGIEKLGYGSARDRVMSDQSSRLAYHLGYLKKSAQRVDVIAHSMGNRLVMKVMAESTSRLVDNLFCFGPAVGTTDFGLFARLFHEMDKRCGNICIFHSRRDGVLNWAYWIYEGERAAGAGQSPPRTLAKNVQLVDVQEFVPMTGHSAYYTTREIYTFIQARLRNTWPDAKSARFAYLHRNRRWCRMLPDGSHELITKKQWRPSTLKPLPLGAVAAAQVSAEEGAAAAAAVKEDVPFNVTKEREEKLEREFGTMASPIDLSEENLLIQLGRLTPQEMEVVLAWRTAQGERGRLRPRWPSERTLLGSSAPKGCNNRWPLLQIIIGVVASAGAFCFIGLKMFRRSSSTVVSPPIHYLSSLPAIAEGIVESPMAREVSGRGTLAGIAALGTIGTAMGVPLILLKLLRLGSR